MKQIVTKRLVELCLVIIGVLSTICLGGDKLPEATEREYWTGFAVYLLIASVSWFALSRCVKAWHPHND